MLSKILSLAFVDLCTRDLSGVAGTEWGTWRVQLTFSVGTEPKPLNIQFLNPSEPVGLEELCGQSLQLMSGVDLCSSVPAGQGCIMIGCIE
jgi:hypothetical protein